MFGNHEANALRRLKNLLATVPEIEGEIATDDKNLLKFLYSKRLCVSTTFSLITNYVRYKKSNPWLFDNLTIFDENVRAAVENSLPELLPYKDRKCRSMIIFHAANWNATITLTAIYKALLLCFEYALQDLHTQNNGFVIIINWAGFTLKKLTWLNPMIVNSMIYAFRACYPVKILEMHFLDAPWFVNAAFNVFKRSFSDELRENFYVHGNNLSTLHEFIHKDVLPSELGGSKPTFNTTKLVESLEVFSCKKF